MNFIEHNTHPDFDDSDPIIPETTITITSPPPSSHGNNSTDKSLRRKRSSLNLKNNSQGEDESAALEAANGKHEPTDNEKEDAQRYYFSIPITTNKSSEKRGKRRNI